MTSKSLEIKMRQLDQMRGIQEGSALIMVILMLSLMVSVAVSFMNIVGRQHGSATAKSLQTHADIALQQAQTHTIGTFVKSIKKTTQLKSTTTEVDFTTAINAAWRKEFNAVIDEDGDPWTEDDRMETKPTDKSTLSPANLTTGAPSGNSMINTDRILFDMMGHDYYGGYRTMEFGEPEDLRSRWYNHAYLTTDLKPIEIDSDLPEDEKVILRKSARYVVRYTSHVYDVNGALSINHNFPEGNTTEDSAHYIRSQNYLRCYGRSIKSMSTCWYTFSNGNKKPQYRVQQRYDPNFTIADPFDHETVAFDEDGLTNAKMAGGDLSLDFRLRLERGFRGGSLHHLKSADFKTNANNLLFLGAGQKGRINTWSQMSTLIMGASDGSPYYWYTPFADSMRDADLAQTGDKIAEVSTPWRVNMLSASIHTLNSMICGLSSEARLSRLGYSNADLFGKEYPEPFPLEFDAGRNVPLIGLDKKYKI
ncbi:MAG: hypothetical protein HRU15_02500, partial [Planctomycetes bacterium]|nr:hypothetical protein [Planctomycetota bacterium]